jgi:hypothetical protein
VTTSSSRVSHAGSSGSTVCSRCVSTFAASRAMRKAAPDPGGDHPGQCLGALASGRVLVGRSWGVAQDARGVVTDVVLAPPRVLIDLLLAGLGQGPTPDDGVGAISLGSWNGWVTTRSGVR